VKYLDRIVQALTFEEKNRIISRQGARHETVGIDRSRGKNDL